MYKKSQGACLALLLLDNFFLCVEMSRKGTRFFRPKNWERKRQARRKKEKQVCIRTFQPALLCFTFYAVLQATIHPSAFSVQDTTSSSSLPSSSNNVSICTFQSALLCMFHVLCCAAGICSPLWLFCTRHYLEFKFILKPS